MLSSTRCVIDAVRRMRACVAFVGFFIAFSTHAAAAKSDIVVANVHGDVHVTMAGATSPLYVGAILQLPATIRTGKDGALELRQGPTTVAAAANTELEIPQSAAEGGLIERIVQIRGNAFYSVGKRERTKLRVETPYLVAVIKGTQFNVAAQEDATTIALFEGRLEVRASDESDLIDLRAGEIAIRSRGEPTIRTLQMNSTARAPSTNDARVAGAAAAAPVAPAGIEPARSVDATEVASTSIARSDPGTAGEISASASAGIDLNARVDAATENLSTETSRGTNAIDAGVDATSAPIVTNASVGAINGEVDVGNGTSVNADVGVGSVVSAGVGASVGNSIDTSLSASVGTVGTSVATAIGSGGADVSVDVGAGSLAGAAIDTTVSAGTVDASVGANVGDIATSVAVGATPAGGIDVSIAVDNPAGVGVGLESSAGAPAAVDVGIDVGSTVGATVDTSGTVAAGVDVGTVVDVDVDLGAGTIDVDVGGKDTGGGLVGGIVGGLLGGRKGK